MGHHEHEKLAQSRLNLAVLTFTDTRDEKTDTSGKVIMDLLIANGHKVVEYGIHKEEPEAMKECIEALLKREDIDALITNGGTGLSRRDHTIEVARPFFTKEMEGFGEIFRLLSFQQIGPAAILSRATAGVSNGKIVICLPGSSKAVKLAMERIIIPQLAHMLWEIRR